MMNWAAPYNRLFTLLDRQVPNTQPPCFANSRIFVAGAKAAVLADLESIRA